VYRFALRGRWLAGLVLVVLAAGVCVRLGIWQLDRLDQRRDRNRLIEERSSAPIAPLGAVVAPDGTGDGTAFRRVVVFGHYAPEHEVLVRGRSLDGRPGQHVVTPLVTDGDTAVLVNRGFVPVVDPDAPVPPQAAAPEGAVRVEGFVRETEERGRFGPSDPAAGRLTHVARIDVERLDAQIPFDLFPVFVQRVDQQPAGGAFPVALPAPELGEGPHLSYAVQWFLFATVFLVGWPVLVYRTARQSPSEPPPLPDPPEPPDRMRPSSSLQVGQTG